MKKSTFTILFVLIIFSLFYTPNSYSAQDSSSCSKYTSSNCPSSQCELKSSTVSKPGCKTSKTVQTCVQSTNPNNQNPNEECPYDQNTLSDKNKRVSANFNYEGKITSGWEFGLNGNEVAMYRPVIYSTQSPPNMEPVQVNEISSNGNCKYYSFIFQRPQQTLTYNLPSQSSTPQNINGELSCLYNKYSIREGPSRISLIPGNPVTNIDQVCPELKKLPSQDPIPPPSASPPLSPPSCPPNSPCTVQVQKGPEEAHGFIVETTDCGQEVKMDNGGAPIIKDLLLNNAIVALSSCSDNQNPEQNTENNKCGNGIVDEGEDCDDTDNDATDGCDKCKKTQCSKTCKSYDGKNSICCGQEEDCASSKWGDKSKVWCAQNPAKFSCPSGTAKCTLGGIGDGIACCPSGWSCKTYKSPLGGYGASWCSPDSKSICESPKSKLCNGENGGAEGDNYCCMPEQQCASKGGYSWCKTPESTCKSKGEGYTPCGDFYCCTPDQVCQDNGFKAVKTCTWKKDKSCPTGMEKCSGSANGYTLDICCNSGKCISSSGPPTCSDNIYYP